MKPKAYNPQEILISLLEIEKSLRTVIKENCPEKSITLNEDLDKALNDLLGGESDDIDKVEFLTTQLSLLHLKREIEKTIKVVLETNDLRAFLDYSKHKQEILRKINKKKNAWGTIDYILLIALCANFIAVALALYYLR